jgi:hypothetical protein
MPTEHLMLNEHSLTTFHKSLGTKKQLFSHFLSLFLFLVVKKFNFYLSALLVVGEEVNGTPSWQVLGFFLA